MYLSIFSNKFRLCLEKDEVKPSTSRDLDRWPSMEDTTRILNNILQEMGFTRDENDIIRKSL